MSFSKKQKLKLEEQKNKVQYYLNKWKFKLLLNHWTFHIEYKDKLEPVCKEVSEYVVDMTCDPCWFYKDAYIDVSLGELLNDSDDQIEANIVHELLHCYISPLWEIILEAKKVPSDSRKHMEHCITGLSNVFMADERERRNLIND